MARFHFDLRNHHQLAFIAVWAFIIAGAISVGFFGVFAGVGNGVAYDWRTGTSPSFYNKVNAEPDGWQFVDFSSGTTDQFGIWVPQAVPAIGSRELAVGNAGEDVLALQKTLNLVRTTDENDPNYYDLASTSGIYDQSTVDAVYTLQGFFGYPQDGVADYNFQASLYQQAVTVSK